MEEPYHPSIVVYDAAGADGVTYHASAVAGSACNGSIPVYAGTKRINNADDDDDVAVQFAGDNKEAATRLRMECFRNDLLSAEHPHVVGVTKHFTYDGFFCVVLPRFDTTLRALFHQVTRTRIYLNKHESCIVLALRDVLRGLSFIHGEGHVHGQIDADHVYLNYYSYENERRRRPKEIKLGYAASIWDFSNTERRRSSVGGSIYLPDELLTRKSDMWSVGIMALELAYDIDVRFFKERSVLDALLKRINESKRLPSEEQMSKYMIKKSSSSSLLLRRSIIGHGSTNKWSAFSKHFSGMIAQCLDPDPFKRPSADGLLNAHLFKRLDDEPNHCLLGDISGNIWTDRVGPVIDE